MNKEEEHKRVIAYIRKSSEDNDRGIARKQLNSLKYQKQFVKDVVKDKGLTLVHPIFEGMDDSEI